MATALDQKRSTERVLMPCLSGPSWDAMVSEIQEDNKPEALIIERAATEVMLRRDILDTDECGKYLVQSSDNPREFYRTSTWECSCPDATHRQRRCKHMWAINLLHTATARARRETLERRALWRQAAARIADHGGVA
jgi:uncharacterized Zn finger protein